MKTILVLYDIWAVTPNIPHYFLFLKTRRVPLRLTSKNIDVIFDRPSNSLKDAIKQFNLFNTSILQNVFPVRL